MDHISNPEQGGTETDGVPLIWATTPYRLEDGKIQWLEEAKTPKEMQLYDKRALREYERCVELVCSFPKELI
jgi:hypothetical protein